MDETKEIEKDSAEPKLPYRWAANIAIVCFGFTTVPYLVDFVDKHGDYLGVYDLLQAIGWVPELLFGGIVSFLIIKLANQLREQGISSPSKTMLYVSAYLAIALAAAYAISYFDESESTNTILQVIELASLVIAIINGAMLSRNKGYVILGVSWIFSAAFYYVIGLIASNCEDESLFEVSGKLPILLTLLIFTIPQAWFLYSLIDHIGKKTPEAGEVTEEAA